MASALLVAAILCFACSGLPGLLPGVRGGDGERVALLTMLSGTLAGLATVALTLIAGTPTRLDLPWPVPGGRLSLLLDPLAAVFLLPVLLVAGASAVYAAGYWPQRTQPRTGPRLRFWFGLICAALCTVLVARNAVLFLAAWEVMAVAGFFLINTEEERSEARQAAFLYLVLAHLGALFLFAMFTLLHQVGGSFSFPAAGSLSAATPATAVFLLGLFGFGIKAGLVPLHVWLPGAHAAAPSHISAFLSGVMLKSGIYGLLRLTGWFAEVPAWWGGVLLALGVFSAILGVVFALAQHDLKRLLAYHSVENIGIIAIGLGLALLGRTSGQPALVALGLAGCLLHVINHGLFKALLFLGAGAVVHATGTRRIDHYGGLLRRQPLTGVCFLGGAVAICGLPPLNGFVSEWLIYLGLFAALDSATLPLRFAALAAPALALTGALALACFVKVFGVTFLGHGRSSAAKQAHEAPPAMLGPMFLLLAACVAIGLLPGLLAPWLAAAGRDWLGAGAAPLPVLDAPLAPLPMISMAALLLLALLVGLWLLQRRLTGPAAPRVPTWGCGYTLPSARMQYTASSFAATLTGLFAWTLRSERHGGTVRGLFPEPVHFESHTPDPWLERLFVPLCRRGEHLCVWLRARLQNGLIGFYLLYVALTVVGLLALAALQRGTP